jgi:hypothetical protein
MTSPRLALPRLRRRLKGKKGVNRHASPYRLKNYARVDRSKWYVCSIRPSTWPVVSVWPIGHGYGSIVVL